MVNLLASVEGVWVRCVGDEDVAPAVGGNEYVVSPSPDVSLEATGDTNEERVLGTSNFDSGGLVARLITMPASIILNCLIEQPGFKL